MGIEGTIPPLHVGGVHEAVTEPAPAAGAVTLPMLPKDVLVPPVTPTDAGLLVLQVKETAVRGFPKLSITVASSVEADPTVTVVGELFSTERLMDCTGQVVNDTGWLFTLPTLAKIRVDPGLLA
jgi:hypothetical protein